MRFRYSFQKIVDLKSNEKTQAEWVLSDAVSQLQTEESSLLTLHSERNNLNNHLASVAEETTISNLMLCQNYMNHINKQITKKNNEVQLAQQNVSVKQDFLSSKMMEEKVWTKAREKAKQVFTTLKLKKEQDVLDEMATIRFKHLS